MICHEEMEQARGAKVPEQAEVRVAAKVVAVAGAGVSRQAPADTASARTAGKGCRIN